MNTPEPSIKENNNENKEQDLEKLQAHLLHNQLQRTQPRNYARILHEYNTPAQWYKGSPVTRSIYFYDPQYQRYLQQQSKPFLSPRPSKTNIRVSKNLSIFSILILLLFFKSVPSTIRVQERPINQLNSQSRTKYTGGLHNYQQKQFIPSRLRSVPVLPPIMTSKNRNDE
jgi:hypothetical protein